MIDNRPNERLGADALYGIRYSVIRIRQEPPYVS